MSGLDWLFIGLYFALLLGITWFVIRRSKDTAADYFLASRNLGWFIVGASIFASNIGSEHLVGLAGAGATSGVALAHYELHAWCLLVLAWVFVPFYMRSMVYTMPEFLERRFSPGARWVLSIISLVAYVLTKFAVGIFAGGVVFATLLPEAHLRLFGATLSAFWVGSVAVVALTGIYTIAGGMRGVAYTDAAQTIVLIIGSVLITVFGLARLGGWHELRAALPSDMFNLWKPLIPPGFEGTWAPVKEPSRIAWYFNDYFPWLGMLFCAPIVGLWYWTTDQYIVQRALAAPNEQQARRGSIFAGNPIPDAAQAAFPLMVRAILPAGIRGLVVAGLLAALMSSLAGAFNACSTLFTMDIYQKLRPGVTQHQLVWTGRVATAVMVLIGLLWIPVIQGGRGLYFYLQGVQAYLAPPIFTVFFFGVFMRRLNAQGALAALVVGFLLGVFRLAVDTPVSLQLGNLAHGYAPSSFLWVINNIYFQYYSLFIFIVSAATMVIVSYLTPAPAAERLVGLTYATVTPEQQQQSRASWTRGDVVASAIVLVLILAAYLYFRG